MNSDNHEPGLLRPGDGWRLLGAFVFFVITPGVTVYLQTQVSLTGNPSLDLLWLPIVGLLFCMMVAVQLVEAGNAKRARRRF